MHKVTIRVVKTFPRNKIIWNTYCSKIATLTYFEKKIMFFFKKNPKFSKWNPKKNFGRVVKIAFDVSGRIFFGFFKNFCKDIARNTSKKLKSAQTYHPIDAYFEWSYKNYNFSRIEHVQKWQKGFKNFQWITNLNRKSCNNSEPKLSKVTFI